MSRFAWPDLMRAGMLGLRLKPDEFWTLTPAELGLLLGENSAAPLQRKGLDALMAAYPDDTGGNAKGQDNE